ncbi:MAG TPA: hypothetical protein PKH02_10760 [Bacteroidales bacterium]|nr:hypothetical protein [Bacteroidales bacterium]
MKNVALGSLLTIALLLGTTAGLKGQNEERLGLPGDNLNLYGVMKLFQESPTLEEFERNLNDPSNMLNNLDLNGDYQVDYINVIDYVDGNVHNIVLRVSLNKVDYQDVAVFTVQPGRNGEAYIQLIGDEALYGRNYIIEPYYDNGTPNPGYSGNTRVYYGQNVTIHRTTTVEVSAWPIVRFIFAPTYVVWHSPWYFGYYPRYWSPWRPYYWDYYVGYHNHWSDYYFGYYHRWNTYRYNRYNDFYYHDHRHHSDMIDHRIADNYYRDTYSRPDLRDKGSDRFREMHPNGTGHTNNGNHYGQTKDHQNNGNHYGNNNSQGQGRPSTTTRPDQQSANQAGRRTGGSYVQGSTRTSTEGQMVPNQGQRTNTQYGSQNNNGSRNNQQSGTRTQYSGSRTSTQSAGRNANVQQTSNRGSSNASYSRPVDRSGDRPTTVPGSSRSSMGGGQSRSSSGQSAVHSQSGGRNQSSGSGSKPASSKSSSEKESGGRRK